MFLWVPTYSWAARNRGLLSHSRLLFFLENDTPQPGTHKGEAHIIHKKQTPWWSSVQHMWGYTRQVCLTEGISSVAQVHKGSNNRQKRQSNASGALPA